LVEEKGWHEVAEGQGYTFMSDVPVIRFFRHIGVGPITLFTSCHINVLTTHGLAQEFIHY
jgi:hypothetical protein